VSVTSWERSVDRAVAAGLREARDGSMPAGRREGFMPAVRRVSAAAGGRLRVNPRRLNRTQARRALGTLQGIFVAASRDQARQWAQRAAPPGAVLVDDPPHVPGGRPHFHIEYPGGARSGHIFYGRVPRTEFFAGQPARGPAHR
jgi:hypothetical protein